MTKSTNQSNKLSPQVKALGTAFLLFQLLFALNNYGPQRVPVLDLFFDEPWVGGEPASGQPASVFSNSAFELQDITKEAGLDAFVRAAVNDDNPSYLEVMGGGVAVADYDGDGWEDLFFTGMDSFPREQANTNLTSASSVLFRNKGDGTFENTTDQAGLNQIEGYPQGALFFDFNNDGTQDLYVASYRGGQLFLNRDGKFIDITDSAGLKLNGRCGDLPCFVSSATASDYNRDGHLDLLLINNVSWDLNNPDHLGEHQLFPAFFKPQPSLLFRNNGDGTFTDVTIESGITNKGGKGLSAVWTDLDKDGWPDLYIANDLSHNRFYFNNHDGTFNELATGMNLDEIKSSMGVNAADYDNDGDWDLVTTNLKGTKISLFRNTGDYEFDYVTDQAGLISSREATGWGVMFVDLDLDGYQDLVMSGGPVWEEVPTNTKNMVFKNLGNGRFNEIESSASDTSEQGVSRGLAVLDIDRSGTPDLVFANIDGSSPRLLKNTADPANNWIKLELQGTVSNRDAVGARVNLIRTDGVEQMQEIRAGSSYQSSSTKSLFFGLGDSAINKIIIHWPSGNVDTLEQIQPNQTLHVSEQKPNTVSSSIYK